MRRRKRRWFGVSAAPSNRLLISAPWCRTWSRLFLIGELVSGLPLHCHSVHFRVHLGFFYWFIKPYFMFLLVVEVRWSAASRDAEVWSSEETDRLAFPLLSYGTISVAYLIIAPLLSMFKTHLKTIFILWPLTLCSHGISCLLIKQDFPYF